jgi:diguanylate cyclase (GGDEF)-like protein
MDERLRILLIDDDEDEFFILKQLLSENTKGGTFYHYELDWLSTFEEAKKAVSDCRYDLFLVDYHLGSHNGLDVLRVVTDHQCTAPIIILTGQGDYKTDLTAMELGAADYLEKGQLTRPLLERSIRYAVERARHIAALQKQAQEIDALQKATSSLLDTLDLTNLTGQILDATREAISAADHSWLHLLEQPAGKLQHLNEIQFADPRIQKVKLPENRHDAIQEVYDGRPILLSDVQTEPELLSLVESEEQRRSVRSVIAAPLTIAQNVFGAITASSALPSAFDEDDLRLLSSFALTASAAIHNSLLYAETQNLATHDPLTDKLNRRTLFEYGQREVNRARRFGHPLSALMFDVDHFKDVNDRHGHAVGDKVLVTIAERASKVIRNVDFLGRYGGDEFAVLLPEADSFTAKDIAERIRSTIQKSAVMTEAGAIPVSISVGVAQADSSTTKFSALLHKADQALYQSKQMGRNRTTLAT